MVVLLRRDSGEAELFHLYCRAAQSFWDFEMPLRLALALLAFAFFAPSAQAQSDPTRLARGTFREYLELLSLPNDSVAPADIQKNVEWLERAVPKRGVTTEQPADPCKPT